MCVADMGKQKSENQVGHKYLMLPYTQLPHKTCQTYILNSLVCELGFAQRWAHHGHIYRELERQRWGKQDRVNVISIHSSSMRENPPLKGQRALQEGNGRLGVQVTMSRGSPPQPLACLGQSKSQRQYSLVT